MFFISLFSRFKDRFAPVCSFHRYVRALIYSCLDVHVHQRNSVVINVLVVVYNKTWENRVMLFLHGQLVLDIWPRC